jgi:predicted dehydrogenase
VYAGLTRGGSRSGLAACPTSDDWGRHVRDGKVGVGVIGAGFGRLAQLPAFQRSNSAELVALCSGHLEKARTVAAEFGIPLAFDDYRELLRLPEVDLVSVATPPYLHRPMVLAALEAGKHVICEKPMAMNADEAREMLDAARQTGLVHNIDHELRFNPTHVKARELISAGFVGRLRHVTIARTAPFNADPMGRPWGWWFQAGTGGGILGAMASHYVDQMRWWIGEIRAVAGRLSTLVPQRRLPDNSGMRAVETDDACTFMMEFAGGGEGTVFLSTVAHHPQGYRAELFGDDGSLILDAQERLWGARRGESQLTEYTVADPAADLAGIEKSIWARSFVHLVDHVTGAVAAGVRPTQGATFEDGLRCQQVLDAIHASWDERRWVEVAS